MTNFVASDCQSYDYEYVDCGIQVLHNNSIQEMTHSAVGKVRVPSTSQLAVYYKYKSITYL